MAREIKSWTFDQQSSISYLLRITLGPLAGLAVSLFMIENANMILTTESLSEIESNGASSDLISSLGGFGPLAAAFIVGYTESLTRLPQLVADAFTYFNDLQCVDATAKNRWFSFNRIGGNSVVNGCRWRSDRRSCEG